MALTYTSYVTTLANLVTTTESDSNFVQILPSAIEYAENRIYRELNLLSTIVRDSSSAMTANVRNFTLPSGTGRFVVVYGINVYTPVATQTTRNPLVPTSRDYIDMMWPSNTAASATTIPTMFAMITDQTIILGPPPGDAFTVEVIGTIKPAALSSGNATTYLTSYLPDLFLAASMIFMTGYMKNFGAQADDPKMATSWEGQYQTLLQGVDLQTAQQKFAATSWTSQEPQKFAVPQRG